VNRLIVDLKLQAQGVDPIEPITPERLAQWGKYRSELEGCTYRADIKAGPGYTPPTC
jgi:hypothetical protein